MKISVVMATYNGEQYIVQQLDTIRNQTKKIDELIICDDRSSDQTVSIVEDYIHKYGLNGSWSIIVNEENLGYANNFHKATLLATGDLIFFSDQDDLWREDKVEIMTKIMEANSDCQVLSSDYLPYYDGMEESAASKKALKKMPDNGKLEKINLSKKSIYIGALGCCMCVRREFYHNINQYWFDNWAQDDRMWRLSQCADGCYILHSRLIKHRIHANNTSTYGKYHTSERRLKLFHAMQNANEIMSKMLQDNGTKKKLISIMRKHISMMRHRIEMLEKRKVLKVIPLVLYLTYYQEVKSYLVEIYMLLRNK